MICIFFFYKLHLSSSKWVTSFSDRLRVLRFSFSTHFKGNRLDQEACVNVTYFSFISAVADNYCIFSNVEDLMKEQNKW